MAKVSMLQREKKRAKLVERDFEKRAKLRAILKDQEASFEDKMKLRKKCRLYQETQAHHVVVTVAR